MDALRQQGKTKPDYTQKEKTMKKTQLITQRIKDLWQARHWTTKTVWTAGAVVFTLALLFILIYPPIFHAMEGLTVVEGEVVAQGVLNNSVGIAVPLNISCDSGCPWIDGQQICADGMCYASGARVEVNLDSFGVRGWDGKVSSVVASGLRVGERVKLALKGSEVVERGGVLWDFQGRYLKGLFVVPLFLDYWNSLANASREAGWGLPIYLFVLLFWFCIGFLVIWDNLLVRFLNSFFVVYLILMVCFNLPFSLYLLYHDWMFTPIVLLQEFAVFLSLPLVFVLLIINIICLIKWVIKESKKS